MGAMSDANNQLGGQAYYDRDNAPSQSPLQRMLSMQNGNNRNYLINFDNQSMIKPNNTPYNYIDINALFPQLMQGGGNQGVASLLGDNAIGATQSASSGAGRFM